MDLATGKQMNICCTVSNCKPNDYGHFLGLVRVPLNIVNCTVHRGAEVGCGREARRGERPGVPFSAQICRVF